MGMHTVIQPTRPAPAREPPTNVPGREPTGLGFVIAAQYDKKRLAENTGTTAIVEPASQSQARLLGDRNDPLLAPLAHHTNLSLVKVDIANVQGRQLTDANARSVEEFHDGSITQSRPALPGLFGPFDGNPRISIRERKTVVHRKRSRSPLREFRRRNSVRWVEDDPFFTLKKAKESPDAGKAATESGCAPLAVQTRQPCTNPLRVNLVGTDVGSRKVGKQRNIGQIGATGVRGESSLDAQVAVKILNRVLPIHEFSGATTAR
jgi:hypothetical protein